MEQFQNFLYHKLTQPLLRSLFGHIRILFYDLDCIKDQSKYGFTKDELFFQQNYRIESKSVNLRHQSNNIKQNSFHLNWAYFFPFLISFYIAFDGLLFLAQNSFHYEPTKMEALFSHLVFPRAFWPQADIMLGLAIAMSFTVFPLLMIDPMLDRKFVMYLLEAHGSKPTGFNEFSSVEILMVGGGGGNGQTQKMSALPKDETLSIVSFRRRARPLIRLMMATLTVQVESFAVWNLANHISGLMVEGLSNQTGNSSSSFLRLYMTALSMVLFFFYGNISNLYMLFYFGLAVRYIRVKQRCRWRRVVALAEKIDRKIANSFKETTATRNSHNSNFNSNNWTNRRKQLQNSSLWRRLTQVRCQMLALFEEVRAQNRFWSKYLTIYFVVYIVEIVYLTYSYFFLHSRELGPLQLSFFPLFAVNFALVLVLVTLECSQVVAKNCLLHQAIQRALLQLQRIYPLTVGDQLAVDSMAANYRNIPRICFKMLNSYRINSQMFQMLFSYTSLLFFMVVRKN